MLKASRADPVNSVDGLADRKQGRGRMTGRKLVSQGMPLLAMSKLRFRKGPGILVFPLMGC